MNIELKPIQRHQLNDVAQAYYETNPRPCGNWKKFWTMKLIRKNHRCQLPRGFKAKTTNKGIQWV